MYRAKVEAISGTKVYAGGKWLRCIGNKSVRVGEMVWTDGRCVYGHNQISQQPLIVTAPAEDDEGIPIIVVSQEYTYPSHEKYKFYIFAKGKLKFIKTLLEKGGFGIFQMMINDTKNVFYSTKQPNIQRDKIRRNLRATNIDKKGNRYDMLLVWTIYTDEDGDELVDHTYIEIVKNEKVIKNIDLQLADPNNFSGLFIENENNWHFVVMRRTPTYYEGVVELITNAGTFTLETWVLDDPEHYLWRGEYEVFSIAASTETKYMLHNGYYYKARFSRYFTGDGGRGRYTKYWFDFYSPKNIKILSTEDLNIDSSLNHDRTIALTKVGDDKYLLTFTNDINEDGNSFFGIIEKGKITELIPKEEGILDSDEDPYRTNQCINQNFIAVKNCKGLQNRIKELTVIE